MEQVHAGELDVGYVDTGPAGGPAVLLLHGWPYDIHGLDEVTPILVEQGYRVVVPLLRGPGTTRFRADDTPRDGEQVAFAVDTRALTDALGIERAGRSAYADSFTGPYEHRVLDGVGHDVPQEAPADVARAVIDVARRGQEIPPLAFRRAR